MLPNEEVVQSLSILDMVSNSTLLAKIVLLILLMFSVVSWTIIFAKFFVYRLARNEDNKFLAIFSKAESLTNIYNYSRELKHSPVARVFLAGYRELYLFQEKMKNDPGGDKSKEPMRDVDIKGIELSLNKGINREIERLSNKLELLATTGSITPFIGLFGTVWGIMHSFRVIGVQGSASIGGVAPGIAEALIATAAGLVAAIPAVIFFNYLNNKIRIFGSRMDDFSRDFVYLAEKNFMR
ncbi:MAG: protein TolQ [Nitrospinales bacterium]